MIKNFRTTFFGCKNIAAYHQAANRFIGAVPFENELTDVRFLPWEYDTEAAHMQEFDIGIMPLLKEDYVWGKAGYKLLQYMAMGIPSVTSPWGVNSEIIEQGITGYLAESEQEWLEYLEKLITDADLQEKMGVNARHVVVEKYSIEVRVLTLCNILDSNTGMLANTQV